MNPKIILLVRDITQLLKSKLVCKKRSSFIAKRLPLVKFSLIQNLQFISRRVWKKGSWKFSKGFGKTDRQVWTDLRI